MSKVLGEWRHIVTETVSPEELARTLDSGAAPTLAFYFMLSMSAVIATLGLLANSAAVVIGAMIVAPLMNPIVALSYNLVSGRWASIFRALMVVFTGVVLTVAIALLITESIGWKLAGSEILSRTRPTLLDLGVAMAAGAAAALALTRPAISSSLAGVAIAVALVPPLCTAGIVFVLGDSASIEVSLEAQNHRFNARGPLLLFLSNFFGILLASGLVYYAQYFRRQVRAALRLVLALASLVIVFPVLGLNMENLLIRNQVHRSLNQLGGAAFPNAGVVRLTSIRVWADRDTIFVRADAVAPKGAVTQNTVDALRQKLAAEIGRPVSLELSQIPVVRWTSVESMER